MSIKIKRERKKDKIGPLHNNTRILNYINFNSTFLHTFRVHFYLGMIHQVTQRMWQKISKNFLTKILWMSRFQSVSNATKLQCTNVTEILVPLNRSTPRKNFYIKILYQKLFQMKSHFVSTRDKCITLDLPLPIGSIK